MSEIWDEYVNKLCNSGQDLFNAEYTEEEFREWMNPREVLGKMWSYEMWIYWGKIYKKINYQYKDHVTIICGEEGLGKSRLATMIGWTMSLDRFKLDSYIYTYKHLYPKLRASMKGDSLQIDEGELLLHKGNQMTEEQLDFILTLQQIRTKQVHLSICIPSYWDLNKEVSRRRASTIIYLYYYKPLQQMTFRCINLRSQSRKAIDTITFAYERKQLNLLNLKLPLSVAWMGNCYEKWVYFSYEDYFNLFKMKGADDYLDGMDKKYNKADESGVDSNRTSLISVADAARQLNIKNSVLFTLINKKEIVGLKMGLRWFIPLKNWQIFLENKGFETQQRAKYFISGEEQQISDTERNNNLVSNNNTTDSEPRKDNNLVSNNNTTDSEPRKDGELE